MICALPTEKPISEGIRSGVKIMEQMLIACPYKAIVTTKTAMALHEEMGVPWRSTERFQFEGVTVEVDDSCAG